MVGRIHSYESMGLVDGPGVRFVVFFQGCQLRCLYCHNPDTWSLKGGTLIEDTDLLKKVLRYKTYFKNSGGVTCSGGEPLMQPKFLTSFLKLCKKEGIHTAIDTAGVGLGDYDEILSYTDLVLLDIKHVEENEYRHLTKNNIKRAQVFEQALRKHQTPLWIRHVVVPNLTDTKDHMKKLKEKIQTFENVQKIELLPYHKLGVHKYETLNLPYPLQDTMPMDPKVVEKFEKYLRE